MNGAPTPLTVPARDARTPTANGVRRKRPQATTVLRAPRRPLKTITRPVTSLTHMNRTAVSEATVSVDALRQELLAKGARSYPLVVTRKDLKELRHHVMRLQSRDRVAIQNEEQFTPPVRLHRRDPRAPPGGAGAQFEEEEESKEDLEELRERERMEMLKEERRKIREENQAKIAPTGSKKTPAFQKKTEQKYRADDTPEAKKRQLLRYEETLPWHLEDFDNKQTWVGTYESEMSETHVMLTTEHVDGRGPVVQLVPMERWYRFNMKTKAKSTEDPELFKEKTADFFVKLEAKQRTKNETAEREKRDKGMRTRVGGGYDDEGRIRRKVDDEDMPFIKREADADDIDFNAEEDFADDEEGLNGLFEGEEADVKEATEKLKRDQLGAAAFDLRSEREVYEEEERIRKQEQEAKELERSMRRALVKREKQYDYKDDSDESEDETDSETERQRAKEEEERKAAEQNGKSADGDKPASGTSTKGPNTPSGTHRPVDVNKKKRPGSPNLSEASGNESARKKHKKKHHDKNADPSRKSSLAHLNDGSRRGAASGSDSEMTDAGKQKMHKLKVRMGTGTPGASPPGSRAGSPAAQVNGSRAGSPAASGNASRKSSITVIGSWTNYKTLENRLPSASEIYKALPPQGMTIQALINTFKDRVDKSNTQLFIRLVKAVSRFDKGRSWLTPLPTMPSEDQINTMMRGQKPSAKAASPS